MYSLLSSKLNLLFIRKKHEKTIIMQHNQELKTIGQKTTKVNFYEKEEQCYPFSILEETEVINEEGEVKKSFEPVLGNNKLLDQKFDTKEECEDYIMSKPYELIIALICTTLEMKERYENEMKELHKIKKSKK